MSNKDIMVKFIKMINDNGMLTQFIKYVFNYDCLFDYNYFFRMIDDNDQVIIDIYDNVSDNRFNRYIFDFVYSDYDVRTFKDGDVCVKCINVLNVIDEKDKLLKLAYLFKINNNMMVDFAYQFLDVKFAKILEYIIKK